MTSPEGWCRGHWDLRSEGSQDPRGQWLAQTWLALGVMSPARCYKWGNGGWERGLACLGSQSRSTFEAAFGPAGPATFVSVRGQGALQGLFPKSPDQKTFLGNSFYIDNARVKSPSPLFLSVSLPPFFPERLGHLACVHILVPSLTTCVKYLTSCLLHSSLMLRS